MLFIFCSVFDKEFKESEQKQKRYAPFKAVGLSIIQN